jgi:hypothetical protein
MSKLNKGLAIVFAAAALAAAGAGVYYAEHQAGQILSPLAPPAASCTGPCADVNNALQDLNSAGGDPAKQQAALKKLSSALPVYGAPAMKEADGKMQAYKAANGGLEPSSVLQVYGAKKFAAPHK